MSKCVSSLEIVRLSKIEFLYLFNIDLLSVGSAAAASSTTGNRTFRTSHRHSQSIRTFLHTFMYKIPFFKITLSDEKLASALTKN